MESKRKLIPLRDAIVARPPTCDWKKKAKYAEPTGMGDLLCYETWFGRIFRSDEDFVRDVVAEFCEEYKEMCMKMDEDPAHQYFEVTSYDDLFNMLHLMPGYGPEGWGYSNTEDYRVNLEFDILRHTVGSSLYEKFGEDVLTITPRDYCAPDPCYLEV